MMFERHKKFPFYHQLDNMDCGPTCLKMVAEYYGRKFPVSQLREDMSITRAGGSFLGLSDAAEKIGLRATATMPTYDYFVESIKLPCIVHWNQSHFVVVYKIRRNTRRGAYVFYVADPGYGLLKYNEDEFRRCWISTVRDDKERGVVMVFTPTPKFYDENKNKSAAAVINGDITLGAMLSIQYIIGQMQGPINQLVGIVQQMQDVKISLGRLGEVLDKKDEEADDKQRVKVPAACRDILFSHVDFT